MIEPTTFYTKCTRKHINLEIMVDYEVVGNKRIPIMYRCPLYDNTEDRRGKCSGLDENARPCLYANYHRPSETISNDE